MGIFLFDKILVNFYRIYFIVKNKYGGYAVTAKKANWMYFINNRWSIHISILLIAGLTLFSNINSGQAENYVDRTLIKDIVEPEFLFTELITEDANIDSAGEIAIDKNKEQYARIGYLTGQTGGQNSLSETELIASQRLGALTAGSSAIIKQDISTTEVNKSIRNKAITYTVQAGDTVTGIAAKFGISINTILWENGLSAYSIIRPGKKLTILPETGINHSVKRGQSLNKIAKIYQVETDVILEANKLLSPDNIKTNQKLFIPQGVKPKPKPTKRYYRPSKNTRSFKSAPQGGKFIWPTNSYRITQYYSWRHFGLDIGNKIGQPIYAVADGVVTTSNQGHWNGGYGNVTVIDHGNGFKSRYAHASYNLTKVGDKVVQGQVIAAIGSTGHSTGPHIHFEILINNRRVNPLTYLNR